MHAHLKPLSGGGEGQVVVMEGEVAGDIGLAEVNSRGVRTRDKAALVSSMMSYCSSGDVAALSCQQHDVILEALSFLVCCTGEKNSARCFG